MDPGRITKAEVHACFGALKDPATGLQVHGETPPALSAVQGSNSRDFGARAVSGTVSQDVGSVLSDDYYSGFLSSLPS